MSLFGRALVVAITTALMLPFGTPPGAASHDTAGNLASHKAEGNAVTDWSLIAQTAIAEGRPPGSSQVLHGVVHAAMYDAVIAIEGGFEHYTISPEVDRPASPAAAVAAAAHDVLVARVPAQAPHVDALYEEYLNAIPDRRPRPTASRWVGPSPPGSSPSGPTTGSTTTCPTFSRRPDRRVRANPTPGQSRRRQARPRAPAHVRISFPVPPQRTRPPIQCPLRR
jgi:hypothetical protein